MRDFPSCFGENGVQVADSSSSNSSRGAQNLVTCMYQGRLRGRSCLITVTWSRNLMGQGLSVGIDDSSNQCLCKVDIKPWLFSKRRGSKSLEAYSSQIDIFWDLSSAKFGSGPEPLEGYYVGVVVDRQMLLLLGDMRKEAFKKTSANPVPSSAVCVAKREHIFGKRGFTTRLSFAIMVNKPVMQVKRLRWKFRGNHTILVDGLAVEVFWDVHNWLFGTSPEMLFLCSRHASQQRSCGLVNQPLIQARCSGHFAEILGSKSQSLGFSLILLLGRMNRGSQMFSIDC
ncbi:hypothetical protein D8674_007357 [Pyrus ussuriensis x Pyrus communis]|uniref:DUF868 domain-containing protein n=1 Tax=Pyrus ussuriensis x Pyrus communis TaxID=2448454 RepID=A0A5N5HQG4_9ROSA|nr:hypothetical protein D8674_007357 [Pyrus ussuriensis x Pyrus communis]